MGCSHSQIERAVARTTGVGADAHELASLLAPEGTNMDAPTLQRQFQLLKEAEFRCKMQKKTGTPLLRSKLDQCYSTYKELWTMREHNPDRLISDSTFSNVQGALRGLGFQFCSFSCDSYVDSFREASRNRKTDDLLLDPLVFFFERMIQTKQLDLRLPPPQQRAVQDVVDRSTSRPLQRTQHVVASRKFSYKPREAAAGIPPPRAAISQRGLPRPPGVVDVPRSREAAPANALQQVRAAAGRNREPNYSNGKYPSEFEPSLAAAAPSHRSTNDDSKISKAVETRTTGSAAKKSNGDALFLRRSSSPPPPHHHHHGPSGSALPTKSKTKTKSVDENRQDTVSLNPFSSLRSVTSSSRSSTNNTGHSVEKKTDSGDMKKRGAGGDETRKQTPSVTGDSVGGHNKNKRRNAIGGTLRKLNPFKKSRKTKISDGESGGPSKKRKMTKGVADRYSNDNSSGGEELGANGLNGHNAGKKMAATSTSSHAKAGFNSSSKAHSGSPTKKRLRGSNDQHGHGPRSTNYHHQPPSASEEEAADRAAKKIVQERDSSNTGSKSEQTDPSFSGGVAAGSNHNGGFGGHSFGGGHDPSNGGGCDGKKKPPAQAQERAPVSRVGGETEMIKVTVNNKSIRPVAIHYSNNIDSKLVDVPAETKSREFTVAVGETFCVLHWIGPDKYKVVNQEREDILLIAAKGEDMSVPEDAGLGEKAWEGIPPSKNNKKRARLSTCSDDGQSSSSSSSLATNDNGGSKKKFKSSNGQTGTETTKTRSTSARNIDHGFLDNRPKPSTSGNKTPNFAASTATSKSNNNEIGGGNSGFKLPADGHSSSTSGLLVNQKQRTEFVSAAGPTLPLVDGSGAPSGVQDPGATAVDATEPPGAAESCSTTNGKAAVSDSTNGGLDNDDGFLIVEDDDDDVEMEEGEIKEEEFAPTASLKGTPSPVATGDQSRDTTTTSKPASSRNTTGIPSQVRQLGPRSNASGAASEAREQKSLCPKCEEHNFFSSKQWEKLTHGAREARCLVCEAKPYCFGCHTVDPAMSKSQKKKKGDKPRCNNCILKERALKEAIEKGEVDAETVRILQ